MAGRELISAFTPESGITVLYFTQICGAGTTDQAVDIVNTVFGELL